MDSINIPGTTEKIQLFRNKIAWVVLAGVLSICCLCAIVAFTRSSTPSAKSASTAISHQIQTESEKSSRTMEPVSTLAPTQTPRPTDTPEPTLTPTKGPEPITFEGSGDKIIDLGKWDGPAIAEFVNSGQDNFIVEGYDGENNQVSLIVNEIGKYQGKRPMDLSGQYQTARFSIKSGGQWKVEIFPITKEYFDQNKVPCNINGKGDDVLIFTGSLDIARFSHHGESNFIVTSYSEAGTDLLVNEIGSYQGESIMPNASFYILEVIADGDWNIEISGR